MIKRILTLLFFGFYSLTVCAQADTLLKVLSLKEYLLLPASGKLIDILALNTSIHADIRYATTNNFTGKQIYPYAKALLINRAAEAFLKASDSLNKLGYGIVVYDAYRPYRATVKFWELIHNEDYVANPSKGSRHNRGCAVDISLYKLSTGVYLPMPTEYDDFTLNAHAEATCLELSSMQNRTILQGVMTWAGFNIFPTEWWHFDFSGWPNWPVLDVSFTDLP